MKYLSILITILLITGCSHPVLQTGLQTRQRLVMGTLLSVKLPANKMDAYETIFTKFQEIDNKLSTYRSQSEISRVNNGESVALSKTSLLAFTKSIVLFKSTGGYFNIFTGKKTISARNNPKHLNLKTMKPKFTQNYTLRGEQLKLHSGAKVDLGGMAKGLAVENSLDWLKQNNINHAQISASGDIGCLGPCEIFIQNPIVDTAFLSFKNTSTQLAVSTSGNYRKKSLSHIVNPKTGRFVKHWLSVSLVSDGNNTNLDAYTTAVFSMPKHIAIHFLKTRKIQYILIDFNRNVYLSDGLDNLVSDLKWLNTKDLKIKASDRNKKI